VTATLHAKRDSIVRMPVWNRQGPLRCAALKPIDCPKQAASPVTALELAKDNRDKVLRERNGQQNRSEAFLAAVGISAEL
jgi:hypothetical protein